VSTNNRILVKERLGIPGRAGLSGGAARLPIRASLPPARPALGGRAAGGMGIATARAMPAPESKTAVYAAIAGNLAIAVTKFTAVAITGSSAMLSEGVHSLVDTGNGGLLLLGMRLSRRPPDAHHPFGYGHDLYFWTLLVAVLVFGLGGGISFYEGVFHCRSPRPIEHPVANYIVLGIAGVFEGISWAFAWRAFRATQGAHGLLATIQRSKDPTTFMVLCEDSAALLGLVLAALGVWLSTATGEPLFDAAASIGIGLLLAAVALLLIHESRHLLIGESARGAVVRSIHDIAAGDEAVLDVQPPLTLQLAPDEILVALDVEFRPELKAEEVAAATARVEAAIRAQHPKARYIFVESRAAREPAPARAVQPAGST